MSGGERERVNERIKDCFTCGASPSLIALHPLNALLSGGT